MNEPVSKSLCIPGTCKPNQEGPAGSVTQKLHKETVQPSRLAFALGRARGGLLVEGLVRDGANDLKSGGFNTPPGKMHLQKQTVR